jgi:hypothetical protein
MPKKPLLPASNLKRMIGFVREFSSNQLHLLLNNMQKMKRILITGAAGNKGFFGNHRPVIRYIFAF